MGAQIKAILVCLLVFLGTAAAAEDTGVIEIVTMSLAEGVTPAAFEPVDRAVQQDHVSKQPGFVSRQAGYREGQWAVVVTWQNAEAAQASMDSFATAPAAQRFISMIDPSTLSMTRYQLAR